MLTIIMTNTSNLISMADTNVIRNNSGTSNASINYDNECIIRNEDVILYIFFLSFTRKTFLFGEVNNDSPDNCLV